MTRILSLAALSATLWLQTESAPPLPSVRPETFDAHARGQVREAYETAVGNPADPEANGRLGMLLYAYEQFEMAAPCFERARLFAPRDPRWPYYLGRAQASLGGHARAAASFREALRLNPVYLPAELKLAESLLESGEMEESRKIYETISSRQPGAPAAWYGLGRIHAARGELEAAMSTLHRACELFPEFGAAHFALARAYRDRDDRARAQEHMASYTRNKLAWPPLPDPLLEAIHELKTGPHARLRKGIYLAEQGDLDGAVAEHEQALAADPRLAQPHIHLIRLYGRLGRPEKAEEHYRACVAIDPNLIDSHYNFGVLKTEQKKYAEASQAFRRVLELSPSHAEAHNNLGSRLLLEGRTDEAALHFRAAIESKPNYRLARFNLGRILANQGRFEEAISEFRHTLTPEDTDTPRYLYALAAAHVRSGDRAGGLKHMREALRLASAMGLQDLLPSIKRDLKTLEEMVRP
jgi:tetratricopeptide (TPR) repeat protein